MQQIPENWFVCPIKKTALKVLNAGFVSTTGEMYDNNKGYWDFVPKDKSVFEDEKWDSWSVLQDNATIPYDIDPEKNLGVGPRQDFLNFGNFCKFRGNVLDIGVGPQICPTHIKYNKNEGVFFVGIDPLVGQQPREFPFVLALGEYLPFKEKIFDQTLFVTTLDHFIDPVIALIEAKRVTKDDGDICIWIGEKDKSTPKPLESPEWYKNLKIPEGADDPFHFKRFNYDEFRTYLTQSALKITEEKVTEVDMYRKNIFVRCVKQI
jgi:SAM-dependent methyltransferase